MWQGYDKVVIVDALLAPGLTTGKFIKLDLQELMFDNRGFSSHQIGVVESLQLAQAINMLPSGLAVFGLVVKAETEVLTKHINAAATQLRVYLTDFFAI
jgi:Ni,Fe-hydrogenase maturation factor